MNGGVARNANSGRLELTDIPPAAFNGGAPVDSSGRVYVTTKGAQTYTGGLAYRNDGSLCVSFNTNTPILGYARGGIPLTSGDKVACAVGTTIRNHVHAIPIDIDGRVAVENIPAGILQDALPIVTPILEKKDGGDVKPTVQRSRRTQSKVRK